MKKLLLILVLLVSGSAIGQALTDDQRHLTVARLGGSAHITHHVYQPGLPGITYTGNYHNLNSEPDTYMRITNTGLPTGNELRIGTVDYSTTNAYVESLGETFREANRDGGRIYIDQVLVGRDRNHQFFTLPVAYNPWDNTPSHFGIGPDSESATRPQQTCNPNDGADCLSRPLTITRRDFETVYLTSAPESQPDPTSIIGDGTTTEAEAASTVFFAYGNTVSLLSTTRWRYTASWEAGSQNGQSWTAGSYAPTELIYESGVVVIAPSFFLELHSRFGHHGGEYLQYVNGVPTYEYGALTITYSYDNGGEWRVSNTSRVFTSQRAVYDHVDG